MSVIVHYGTKGMKKGVRKWTNPDGTLNDAGKARYRNGKTEVGGVKVTSSDSSSNGLKTYSYTDQRGRQIGTVKRKTTPTLAENFHSISYLRDLQKVGNKPLKNITEGKRAASKIITKKTVSKVKGNLAANSKGKSVANKAAKTVKNTVKKGKSVVLSLLGKKK